MDPSLQDKIHARNHEFHLRMVETRTLSKRSPHYTKRSAKYNGCTNLV